MSAWGGRRRTAWWALCAFAGLPAGCAAAQGTTPAPAPAPYSLPWQLRAAPIGNVLRLDTAVAFWENGAGQAGATQSATLLYVRRVKPTLGVLGRVAFTHNGPPGAGSEPSGHAFSNPLVGVTYGKPFAGRWRYALFAASTLPVGQGGGDTPDAGAAQAQARGLAARSAMDNALFSVNYWTVIGGAGLARTTSAFSAQAEVTVFQLTRVRGPKTQDGSRTNFTAGLHLGHFVTPRLSLAGELRYQRWLSDAAPVRRDPRARETVTLAAGPRLHFKLGPHTWLRPSLAYARALDDPLKGQGYDFLFFDLPLAF